MKCLFFGFGASKFPFEKEGKLIFQNKVPEQGSEVPEIKQEKETMDKKITNAEKAAKNLSDEGKWELIKEFKSINPETVMKLEKLDHNALKMLEPKLEPRYEIKKEKALTFGEKTKFGSLMNNVAKENLDEIKELPLDLKRALMKRFKDVKENPKAKDRKSVV